MSLYDKDEESTILDFLAKASATGDPQQRLSLLVYHRDGVQVVPLVAGQPVIIGRTRPSTLTLRDKSLSRRHARFERLDDDVWVEDLGSTNGTFVNGERVTRARVRVGDELLLGSVSSALHAMTPLEGQLQGLDSHDRFRAMLEEEVIRAQTFGRSLALVMVEAREEGSLARGCPRVRQQLRAVDRIGLYGPDAVEILLTEATLSRAEQLANAIVGGRTAEEPPLSCGVALYPESARSAEALLAESRRAVEQSTIDRPVRVRGNRDPGAPLVISETDRDGPIVRNAAMVELFETVDRIAGTNVPVLIVGETGTGKEIVARALHQRSDRRDGPMRCINCGAIPEHLVESALFGHERGAFTGADRQAKGVFEDARGGTVFFDEIGELALPSQVALLRVLETMRISRVGSSREIPVDVRVVAATHRELEAMSADGSFRLDLYYRLNTIVLPIPPLRERPDEIDPLCEYWVARASRSTQRRVTRIDSEVLDVLRCYHWPGNVRELRNVIERAVVIAKGDRITVDDLPERLRTVASAFGSSPRVLADLELDELSPAPQGLDWGDRTAPPGGSTGATVPSPLGHSVHESSQADRGRAGTFKDQLQRFEAELIREALIRTHGNQSEAALLLGLPRRTLVHKLKTLGIDRSVAHAQPTSLAALDHDALDFRSLVVAHEANLLRLALEAHGHDALRAARALGMPQRSLTQKARKHGLL